MSRSARLPMFAFAGALAAALPVLAVTRPAASVAPAPKAELVARIAANVVAGRVDATLRGAPRGLGELDRRALFDAAKARSWRRTIELGDVDLGRPGRATVTAELEGLRAHAPALAQDPHEDRRLIGWSAILKLAIRATAGGETVERTVRRAAHLTDITPPAPAHTLFIHSEAKEYLREGTFTLRNVRPFPELDDAVARFAAAQPGFHPVAGESSRDMVDRYTRQVTFAARVDTPALIQSTLERATRPENVKPANAVKDLVDNTILKQNPRTWGRVRTNGVLHVSIPLWAPDDLVNYTADGKGFGAQGAEFGFPGCDNRLHDPFISVYTHYEGHIYKSYRRATGTGIQSSVVPPQRYTINTRMNYVLRYPERAPVPGLARLERDANANAAAWIVGGSRLTGTAERPLVLDGIWYTGGRVTLSGPFTGRGMIVAKGGIEVAGDLTPAAPGARLALVALGGAVHAAGPSTRIHAFVYARDGLTGPRGSNVRVIGNLAVERLNREKMPGTFECWFDPAFREPESMPLVGGVAGLE